MRHHGRKLPQSDQFVDVLQPALDAPARVEFLLGARLGVLQFAYEVRELSLRLTDFIIARAARLDAQISAAHAFHADHHRAQWPGHVDACGKPSDAGDRRDERRGGGQDELTCRTQILAHAVERLLEHQGDGVRTRLFTESDRHAQLGGRI